MKAVQTNERITRKSTTQEMPEDNARSMLPLTTNRAFYSSLQHCVLLQAVSCHCFAPTLSLRMLAVRNRQIGRNRNSLCSLTECVFGQMILVLALVVCSCIIYSCKDIGTQPSDASHFGFRWTAYDVTNSGIPHNWIGCIAFDNNNIAWIGTYFNGIARFDGSSWTRFNSTNSALPSDSIWCMALDKNDHLWVGTTNGLAKFDGASWTVFNQSNSPLPYTSVLSLAVDNNNVLWIGCGHATGGGLFSFDGSNWTLYTPDNSILPCRIINKIVVDRDDTKWIGTAMFQGRGGLVMIKNSVWSVFNQSNSALLYNWVDDIALDNQGNTWVGQSAPIYLDPGILYGALVRFGNDSQQVLKPAVSGKTSNRVYSLACDQRGNIWIGTTPDGPFSYDLTVFDGTTWFVFSSAYSNFPHMFIREIAVDRLNRVWLGTDRGVLVIDCGSSK